MFYAVTLIIAGFLIFGFVRRVPVFDCFISGAKKGMRVTAEIFPTLVGLITAVGMLRASGLLDDFCKLISPACQFLGIPDEIVPMALLRPVSGSGSTALLTSIFEQYSPDSLAGNIASVMAGSSETTFYAITVYYASVNISKTKYTLQCSLLADLAAAVFSVLTVHIMM